MKIARHFATLALTISLTLHVLMQPALAVTSSRDGSTTIQLGDGRRAVVMANGMAEVFSRDHRSIELHHVTRVLEEPQVGRVTWKLPSREVMMHEIATPQSQALYAPGSIIAIFRPGSTPLHDVLALSARDIVAMRSAQPNASRAAIPQYTNDYATNRAFAALGVDKVQRLFRDISIMPQPYELNPASAYRLHVAGANVRRAVDELSRLSSILYVSPDWIVSPMHSQPLRLQSPPNASEVGRFMSEATRMAPSALPRNFASASSLQSMLNAPSDDVLAAYDEIQRHFRQLPGQGEIITNVSVGDVTDSSNTTAGCYVDAQQTGPTTKLIGNQHYLDMPSMPLIPAYTADVDGSLSGSNEVCGVDPSIDEIGLDFSMMAPLPHNLQRSGEQGSGFTDLLGVAPGAQYRLIVPLDALTTISDIDAALLTAATQRPRPNVITASLGFGFDANGLPSRYLEEDPLTEAIVSTIVHQLGIVVCISAGDGTRTFTNAAIGPSGGSVATNVATTKEATTNLSDDTFSTIPSLVYDSGSIDVGGTTLDDIFAAPPSDSEFAALSSQHAFPETRWDGSTLFSSGFGERVNVSAPSDNVISLAHDTSAHAPDAVQVLNNGGTSASAPEVAAVAAVVQQVARLTGRPLDDPIRLREFLEKTGTPVPPVSQADVSVRVGPQVDLKRAVETLMEAQGIHDRPSAAGVAVEQRRTVGTFYLNTEFLTYTDPNDIDLGSSEGFPGPETNADTTAWITIAPNWEFVPKSVQFRLIVGNRRNVRLATTPWARLLPETILRAAGLPLASSQKRTVSLRYEALRGMRLIASVDIELTFGPSGAKPVFVFAPAPHVPSVVTGSKVPVTYDLTMLSGFPPYLSMNKAELVVSEVGRGDVSSLFEGDHGFAYRVPISLGSKGTIDVPVSALEGGGIYGIYLLFNRSPGEGGSPSTLAFTRVETHDETTFRPPAPLLSNARNPSGHFLEIPYGSWFDVSYDVGDVPDADGAMLEISAAGPSLDAELLAPLYTTFNNPNGSVRDRNGFESGSVYYARASGRSGHVRVAGTAAFLYPTMNHLVRVIPTRGGLAVGEASDVSTISMDGVNGFYGGYIGINFGIDATDPGGFFAESSALTNGDSVTALETFEQTTDAGLKVLSSQESGAYYTTGWGVWPGNIGLAGYHNLVNGTTLASYSTINTNSQTLGSSWNPPFPNNVVLSINQGGENQLNDLGAFLVGFGAPYSMFGADLKKQTFSSLYDINAPIATASTPVYGGMGFNALTNTAALAGYDFDTFQCGVTTPTIVTVDAGNGSIVSFKGLANNSQPDGVAVMSSLNVAVVPSFVCPEMALYNLSTHSAADVAFPGEFSTGGLWPVVDATNNDILVYQVLPEDTYSNVNALSAVLLYSPNGRLLKTIERFPLQGGVSVANGIQINTSTHTGYVPSFAQLAPFSY